MRQRYLLHYLSRITFRALKSIQYCCISTWSNESFYRYNNVRCSQMAVEVSSIIVNSLLFALRVCVSSVNTKIVGQIGKGSFRRINFEVRLVSRLAWKVLTCRYWANHYAFSWSAWSLREHELWRFTCTHVRDKFSLRDYINAAILCCVEDCWSYIVKPGSTCCLVILSGRLRWISHRISADLTRENLWIQHSDRDIFV